ncbi:MAG: aldehyde dehydrogenase (NADP(+)) [Cyclobacteriaceae bacterium]
MAQDNALSAIDEVLNASYVAFLSYKNLDGKKKGAFLRAIADEIDQLGDTLLTTASAETNLPVARLQGERARTTGHCRMFAALVEEGSWVEARVDHAVPDRTPLPKPDIRKMMVPVGPVVVFGASNFPLAYSTAGGDTASALAAGCPVIVKGHPAHAATSQMVADAILRAAKKTGMPSGVFAHVDGTSFEVGKALVQHPLTAAVGFTGSFSGGKALLDYSNQRPNPIPVFSEMGSTNPVFLLPESLAKNYRDTAAKLAASITQGVGQFCTNPGLMVAMEGQGLDDFVSALSEEITKCLPGTMLHPGIASSYHSKLEKALAQKGVQVEARSSATATTHQGAPHVASAPASEFLRNPLLAEEVFGPFSLLIRCKDKNELHAVVNALHGQLTCTVVGEEQEVKNYLNVVNMLVEKAGRIIINGVPTGVEVCAAMQHGGPFPATTDARFSSVGIDAIKRFIRPVAFQNFPDALLPDELKESNPLHIWRLVDGAWTR